MAGFDQLSHAVGATTEQLSQLSFAGKLSGIEDIAVPLEKMAHSVGAAATGNQKLIDTFSALGVSTTTVGGKIKSTEQQLLDIADAVSKYNDGLAKTSAVQAIFGRSGAEFIKFLDQGADAIKAAQQEAIELGVSVSSSAAKAADEFESNMTRIGAAFQGVFFKALEEALPVFQSITDKIIEFAKNADNMAPIVEQLAAGFKIIGSVLVIVGTLFEVVGKVIGEFVGSISLEIEALADLAKAFTDPIGAMKNFANQQAGLVQQISNAFAHPVDSAKKFVSDTQDALDGIDNVLEHPIDSLKKFFQTQKDAVSSAPASDVLATLKSGLSTLGTIWGNANDQLNAIQVTAKKIKPDLVLIDQTGVKAIETALDALAKLDDSLKQQIATYGLSGAAATVYDVTLGKLSASVAELDKSSPKQVQSALAQLEKQGKLSAAAVDDINTAIKAGIPPGEALATVAIKYATALDQLKGVDALSKLDSQLLTMTGHLEEASKAAFDLANRPLEITIQTAQEKTAFSGLDDSQKTLEATAQLNALKSQAIAIEDALGKKVADVDAAALASGEGNLQLAGDEAVARQAAIAQLEALYVKAQALANATGMKSAVDQAKALQSAIGAIQFNPKIFQDIDAATAAQKKFNEALLAEKNANDDLALQLANLAKQNADGALTDLDYMAKQDEARQNAIDQLTQIQQQELEVIKNNPGNAQALDHYKKLGVEITGLQTQMGQLAKTVRTDLTDDITNAFVDFADGTKSAKAALQSFVTDFGKQMLQLAAKQLFQKLFDVTGITSGINSIFGAAKPALPAAATAVSSASGLADTTAAATSMGTAITTAATAGGTAMGTAVGTAADLAATAMATAITTAGSEAAAAMAEAISAAGAGSGGGGGGAVGGFASLFSSGAEEDASLATALAVGGPLPAKQLALVGEKGPELYVSDLGEQTAATATGSGTKIPDDLKHAHVIGTAGPEYIKPDVSGFVVPSDTFLKALSDHAAQASNVIPFPARQSKLLDAPELPPAADRLDAELTHVDAPESPEAPATPASLDAPTSAVIMKFENVVKNEQRMLEPYEYEAMLTDRYLQKRQGGGPVSAGKPYLVGEGGPELMVPDSAGTVMNSWDTQSHRSVINNVTNHFLIQSQTGKVDRASQGQIAARTALSVQMASGRNN